MKSRYLINRHTLNMSVYKISTFCFVTIHNITLPKFVKIIQNLLKFGKFCDIIYYVKINKYELKIQLL